MLKIVIFVIILMVMGCNSAPKPFETGARTTAPFGYTDMIERESK